MAPRIHTPNHRNAINMNLPDLIAQYLADNAGFVGEDELINGIVAILEPGAYHCQRWGHCTETNTNSYTYCGSRSLVEHAMGVLHHKSRGLDLG